MITEMDARTKWCPMVRYGVFSKHGSSPAANRLADDSGASTENRPQCRCIASDCMMWRSVETREFRIQADAEFSKTGKRLKCDTGYCGLAGTP